MKGLTCSAAENIKHVYLKRFPVRYFAYIDHVANLHAHGCFFLGRTGSKWSLFCLNRLVPDRLKQCGLKVAELMGRRFVKIPLSEPRCLITPAFLFCPSVSIIPSSFFLCVPSDVTLSIEKAQIDEIFSSV